MSSAAPARRPLAIVTGGTSGIGAAFAAALAAGGHDLLITGRRRELIERVAAGIRERHGVGVEVRIVDLAQPAQLAAFEKRVRAAAGLRILVNNAGGGAGAPFLEDSGDSLAAMLRAQAEAAVRLCLAAVPRLAEAGGGAIINVASMAAFLPSPMAVVYGATKRFLVSFSEALAMTVGDRGIRVQALCPGLVRTDFHQRLGLDPAQMRNRGLARWMSAERVAKLSLAALERGSVVYVPGLLNRFLLAFTRALPRRLYYALAARVKPLRD